jgi:hypothetical protein
MPDPAALAAHGLLVAGTPNQALQQTPAAILVSQSSLSLSMATAAELDR